MKKLYICLIIVLCSMKGFAQFSEYGGTYYDSQYGMTGVNITSNYNPGPNWGAINAANDAYWAAQMAAIANNIPQQPVIPPPMPPTPYIQGTNGSSSSSTASKDYVPKSTDKLVKAGIVTTCAKQSTIPACVLTSLEVTLKNVLGLTVTSEDITTAAFVSTGSTDFIKNGLTPEQSVKLINSFCITETLVKSDFKTAIDNGKTFLTDIRTGTTAVPDPSFPNDRTKDKTVIISHSVSVIGYDQAGNYIYIDPALGKAQVAPSADMGYSYSIIIKGKK